MNATATPFKKTSLTLHVKDASGKTAQHIKLWNHEGSPEVLHGGTASLVDVDGKKEMKILTAPEEKNGRTFQNPSDPFVAFVNRFPTAEQKISKEKPYTGQVADIVMRRSGDKKDVACLIFSNDSENGEFLSGFFNENGIIYTSDYKVDDKAEGTVKITADVVGGLKADILAGLYRKDRKVAA